MEIPQAYRLHRCNACSGDALQEGAQVGTEHNERSASEQAEGRSPDGTGSSASLRDNASSALSGIVSCFMFGSI